MPERPPPPQSVPVCADGTRLLRVRLTFNLERRRRHLAIRAFYLRLHFTDPAVTVLRLDVTRAGPPAFSVRCDGLDTGSAGALLEAEDDGLSGEHEIYALLALPATLPVMHGTVRADASLRGSRVTMTHASGGEPHPFTVRTPPPHDVGQLVEAPPRDMAAARSTGPDRSPKAEAGVRLCLAADIERFSRLRLTEAMHAQERFTDLLGRVRRHAGVDVLPQNLQVSGDGQFIVLPSGIDETFVIPQLIAGLHETLADSNAELSEHSRLRLRVALHRGHVHSGSNGWIGPSAIAVHRLLDSTQLRRALAEHAGADFALIVSDVLYQDVIVQCATTLATESFQRAEVRIPAKNFAETAWIYLPVRP